MKIGKNEIYWDDNFLEVSTKCHKVSSKCWLWDGFIYYIDSSFLILSFGGAREITLLFMSKDYSPELVLFILIP